MALLGTWIWAPPCPYFFSFMIFRIYLISSEDAMLLLIFVSLFTANHAICSCSLKKKIVEVYAYNETCILRIGFDFGQKCTPM